MIFSARLAGEKECVYVKRADCCPSATVSRRVTYSLSSVTRSLEHVSRRGRCRSCCCLCVAWKTVVSPSTIVSLVETCGAWTNAISSVCIHTQERERLAKKRDSRFDKSCFELTTRERLTPQRNVYLSGAFPTLHPPGSPSVCFPSSSFLPQHIHTHISSRSSRRAARVRARLRSRVVPHLPLRQSPSSIRSFFFWFFLRDA